MPSTSVSIEHLFIQETFVFYSFEEGMSSSTFRRFPTTTRDGHYTYFSMSSLYFSLTSTGILERSVRMAVSRALAQSQVSVELSMGIFGATLRRMRWALATLALRLLMTMSTVTGSSDSCQQS